jgi:hypothetical protein
MLLASIGSYVKAVARILGVDWYMSRVASPGDSTYNAASSMGDRVVLVGSNGSGSVGEIVSFTQPDTPATTSVQTYDITTAHLPASIANTTTFFGVANDGANWVAVGTNGTIAISGDGVNWLKVESGTTQTLRSITWTGSKFIAGGGGGVLLHSVDGFAWSEFNFGAVFTIYGITSFQGRLFVVGSGGSLRVSDDGGETWVTKSTGTTTQLNGIAGGTILSGSNAGRHQVAVVGNSGVIRYSWDLGDTWLANPTGTPFGSIVLAGIVWVEGETVNNGLYGRFYIGGASGTIGSGRPDTEVGWTKATYQNTTTTFRPALNKYGLPVFAGNSGNIAQTVPGLTPSGTWPRIVLNTINNANINNFASNEEISVMVSSTGGLIMSSVDGYTWVLRQSGVSSGYLGACWTGSMFVAVGSGGLVARSTDGVSWSTANGGYTTAFNSVTSNGSIMVKVGSSGAIRTSTDGITWTARTSGTSSQLYAVTWSGGLFVATGASGAIRTSPDGITWTGRSSNTSQNMINVVWTGTRFVAVGAFGTIRTSTDGITWVTVSSGTTVQLNGITIHNNRIFISGLSGYVGYSADDGLTWSSVSGIPGTNAYQSAHTFKDMLLIGATTSARLVVSK